MSVLMLHAHKRFAVRSAVRLKCGDGSNTNGLLIEISASGCRISGLGARAFAVDEKVTIHTKGQRAIKGTVRWAYDGIAGINLDHSLYAAQMERIIKTNRPESQIVSAARYGT